MPAVAEPSHLGDDCCRVVSALRLLAADAGESPGLDPRVFWFVSLGVNLIAAAAYVLFLGGALNEGSALVVVIIGSVWTLGTAFLSWRAAQLSTDTVPPAEAV